MVGSTKIAIVDDESLFVEGLRLIFGKEETIELTLTADSGERFLRSLSECPAEKFPEIVLVDILMKPMNGFELVEKLIASYPDLKIIVLSSHYKDNFLGYMVKLGAAAFIPKNADKALLLEAIRCVRMSGIYFTRRDQEMLVTYMRNPTKKPTFAISEDLSERETEVLKLICSEYTNQEIAQKLFISKRTVESHRQRILDKVGAKNTVGLVIYAISNEIHPLPSFTLSV